MKKLFFAAGWAVCLCFAADPPVLPKSSLTNMSVLKAVSPGGSLMAGFVLLDSATVFIRAVGPGLSLFVLNQALLADPEITLYQGTNVIRSNDDWGSAFKPDEMKAIEDKTGAFHLPPDSNDAVIRIKLQGGAYTVSVQASKKAISPDLGGLVLVEMYIVPLDTPSPSAEPPPSWVPLPK